MPGDPMGPIAPVLQYSGLVSISLVLIGWRVVYNNARRIATRSETKSFIDELMKLISESEKQAVDYWLAGRKDRTEPRSYEMLMLAKVALISHKLELIGKRGLVTTQLDELLGLFQDSITLNCEDADRVSLDERISRANEVIASGKALHSELYQQFSNRYPPFHESFTQRITAKVCRTIRAFR